MFEEGLGPLHSEAAKECLRSLSGLLHQLPADMAVAHSKAFREVAEPEGRVGHMVVVQSEDTVQDGCRHGTGGGDSKRPSLRSAESDMGRAKSDICRAESDISFIPSATALPWNHGAPLFAPAEGASSRMADLALSLADLSPGEVRFCTGGASTLGSLSTTCRTQGHFPPPMTALYTLLVVLASVVPAPSAAAASSGPPLIRFVNSSGTDITGLYVVECGAQDYWENLLDDSDYDGSIVDGATAEFMVSPGCWDLYATIGWDETTDVRQTSISLEDDMLHQWEVDYSWMFGEDTEEYGTGTLNVTNHAAQSLVVLYLSPCGESWGDNWVSDEPLYTEQSVDLELSPGCWDAQSHLDDGTVIEYEAFTIREGQTYKIWVSPRAERR